MLLLSLEYRRREEDDLVGYPVGARHVFKVFKIRPWINRKSSQPWEWGGSLEWVVAFHNEFSKTFAFHFSSLSNHIQN